MAIERHDKIISILKVERKIKTKQLIDLFNVSGETIRRDLEILENRGYLKRIHGGAVLDNLHSFEVEYSLRTVKNLKLKMAIGKAAATLIKDGDSIAIDSGTTIQEVVKNLESKNNLTVITNAMRIALLLMKNPTNKVYLTGGLIRGSEAATSGYYGIDFLSNFRVDKTLIGVGGISIESGLTDYHTEETQIRKKMVEIASKVIVPVDYSKFDVSTLNKIIDAKDVDYLVTDNKTSSQILNKFKQIGVNVIVANNSNDN